MMLSKFYFLTGRLWKIIIWFTGGHDEWFLSSQWKQTFADVLPRARCWQRSR